jgi:acetyl-CoA C-acetyltransferase
MIAWPAERVADRWSIGREEMDRFAQSSQERAVEAQRNGFSAREILPIELPDGGVADTDDSPRPNSTLESLASLKPVFREGGRVTAGNSCPLSDGAAAGLVMSESRAAALGITPRARIISSGVSAVDPTLMGVGPIQAIRTALDRAGQSIDDMDVFELNEAFAAQVIPVCQEVGIDPFDERVNPHGGGIAIGHPFGMTGLRIMSTLINGLETVGGRFGIESMCVGGGQGQAMVVERVGA